MIDNILKAIRNSAVTYESREIRYTFSDGISNSFEFSKEILDIEVIINKADSRLYEAKSNGEIKLNIYKLRL